MLTVIQNGCQKTETEEQTFLENVGDWIVFVRQIKSLSQTGDYTLINHSKSFEKEGPFIDEITSQDAFFPRLGIFNYIHVTFDIKIKELTA